MERPENPLSYVILGAALEVHKHLGPGLLESAYETCLAHELASKAVPFARQVPVPIAYKSQQLDCGFRADMIVDGKVLIEIKAVSSIIDIHCAQALTYLKLTRLRLCLILNFNAPSMRQGIKRIALDL